MPQDIDDAFGHWLAGFADGEGSFNIAKNGRGARFCSFRLALHSADLPILEEIQQRLGMGTIWTGHPASQYAARASWSVQSKADCSTHCGLRSSETSRFGREPSGCGKTSSTQVTTP